MYGLYDIQGILRYVGREREDCLAYAELFDLKSVEVCLLGQTEFNEKSSEFTGRVKVHQVMSNN